MLDSMTVTGQMSTIVLFIIAFICLYNGFVTPQTTLFLEAFLIISGFIIRLVLDNKFTGNLSMFDDHQTTTTTTNSVC